MSREANHWKTATWFLLVFLATIILLGAYRQTEPATKTVEAQEFVLKDDSGRVRARLGMKNNQSTIEFYDERGTAVWTVPSKGFKPVHAR